MILEDLFDKVLGVELVFLGDQNYQCHYCLLRKAKDQVYLEEKNVSEGSLAQVMKYLPKGYPTALNLSGKGVVFKNLEKSAFIDSAQIFAAAFPAIQLNDFYIQCFLKGAGSLIHIIRRSLANQVLSTFASAGLNVFSLSLGASVTSVLWSLFDRKQQKIRFFGHHFEFDEKGILIFYSNVPPILSVSTIKVGEQVLMEGYVVCYATAFQLLLQDKVELLLAEVRDINEKLVDFNQTNSLKKKGFTFLTVLFVLLLLSFLIFTHFNAENASLSGKVGAQAASANQIELYKKGIAQDQKVLETLNWNRGYNYGFILNEISSSCPAQLSFTSIGLNHRLKNEMSNKNSQIFVSGISRSLPAVNNYLFLLRDKKWITQVKLLSYRLDTESDDYLFTLQISL